MTSLISRIEYIQPHESLRDEFHSFIYLSDPVCTGDIKAANITIVKGITTVLYCLEWEDVDHHFAGFPSVRCFATLESLQQFVSLNVEQWWVMFGSKTEDED